MFDKLKKRIGFKSDDEGFQAQPNSRGLVFVVDNEKMSSLSKGQGNPKQRLQMILLKQLAEQERAAQIANGFVLETEEVVALAEDEKEIFDLPGPVFGRFLLDIRGNTASRDFKVVPRLKNNDGVWPFLVEGPYLVLSPAERYTLSPPELRGLRALEAHSSLRHSERTEMANVLLFSQLKLAKKEGMDVELNHFEDIGVRETGPPRLTLERQADGSLLLTPNLGADLTPEDLNKRWSQLSDGIHESVLRVKDQLIILDEKSIDAVQEILANRHIPATEVNQFFKEPSAYINASKVDLDSGFSVRVAGIGPLEHISLGAISDEKQDWFGLAGHTEPPEAVTETLSSMEDIDQFEDNCKIAWDTGAEVLRWNDSHVDISDESRVNSCIETARQRLEYAQLDPNVDSSSGQDEPATASLTMQLQEAHDHHSVLLDIARKAKSASQLEVHNLARNPFPHQSEGIDWMAGLIGVALAEKDQRIERLQGALLADDMGLGKTFTALVGVDYYYQELERQGKVLKPILVVAPLTLLSNWEEEVEKTFQRSPFEDVVVLQSNRDLTRFKLPKQKSERRQAADLAGEDISDVESRIRYALKIGKGFGANRLDSSQRLVITTYDTLRNYQFSLARIDWGVVIFDEAQYIKSPNVLQTRAAKALKADFKLLATGTPVENSLVDFWCLLDTAQPGLFGEWPIFRETWIKPLRGADANSVDFKIQHGKSLRDAVGPFMLRRTKEDELKDLPEKTVYSGVAAHNRRGWVYKDSLGVSMPTQQLEAYDKALQDYKAERSRGGEEVKVIALKTLSRLRRICLHPDADAKNLRVPDSAQQAQKAMTASGKTAALLQELNRISHLPEREGRKVIVFLIDRKFQSQLKLWLDEIFKLDISVINGSTKTTKSDSLRESSTRAGLIRQFEARPGFNIIIMSPLAAGTGLTVVEANHVIHLERHWNPAKEAQASDRVYRIGQTRPVHIYLPASLHPTLDSFDVQLDRLLAGKLMLKDSVVVPEQVSENEVAAALGLEFSSETGTN